MIGHPSATPLRGLSRGRPAAMPTDGSPKDPSHAYLDAATVTTSPAPVEHLIGVWGADGSPDHERRPPSPGG